MTLSRTIPALPVHEIAAATAFYVSKLGFVVGYADDGFARITRDDAEVHLWAASDETWKARPDVAAKPVCTGAESFIAGTASCRIQCSDIDALYTELKTAAVLHPTDKGSPLAQPWGTRDVATLDLDGNLLTFFARP